MGDHWQTGESSWYVTSHLGQLKPIEYQWNSVCKRTPCDALTVYLLPRSVNWCLAGVKEMEISAALWLGEEQGYYICTFERCWQVGKYKLAKFQYSRVVEFLQFSDTLEGEYGTERNRLLLAAHLNMALCHLKLSNNVAARESAGRAIELDSKNEKALFRHGMVGSVAVLFLLNTLDSFFLNLYSSSRKWWCISIWLCHAPWPLLQQNVR